MSSTQTPNMNLTVPGIGTELGPQWANDLNSDLSIVDSHNHSTGQGVQITPSGININSDLGFNGNSASNVSDIILGPQSGNPASNFAIYAKGVDLYYTDGNGNHVQITSGGGVNGSPGSISNLMSPASASYISASGTFQWQQDVSTAANMDNATIVLRYPGSYPTPSGNYIALQAPTSLATGFSLTLPNTLPIANSVLNIDTSGNIGYTNSNNLMPSGVAVPFTGVSIPSGFLNCDGTAVSRSTYSTLFGIIGTNYGAGNGTTTFNLPNTVGQLSFNGAAVIPSYVQSYWKMNGAGNTSEINYGSGGSGYNLIQTGDVPSATGWISGLGSRGSYSHLNWFTVPLSLSNTTPYDSQVFSVGFWMKTTTTGANAIMGKFKTAPTNGWFIEITSGNFIAAGFDSTYNVATSINVSDGSWHLVYVAVMSGSGSGNMRIYVDNTEVLFGYWINLYSCCC